MSSSSRRKASVARLSPTINKQISKNGCQVVAKLKKALNSAQSGHAIGALIITVDREGYWTSDLVGHMMHDRDLLRQIGARLVCIDMAPD